MGVAPEIFDGNGSRAFCLEWLRRVLPGVALGAVVLVVVAMVVAMAVAMVVPFYIICIGIAHYWPINLSHMAAPVKDVSSNRKTSGMFMIDKNILQWHHDGILTFHCSRASTTHCSIESTAHC